HWESAGVKALHVPAISQGIEQASFGADEKGGIVDNLRQSKHRVVAQKLEQMMYRRNMDVIQCQDRSGLELLVDVVVLHLYVRVPVRTVEQSKIAGPLELKLGERLLSRAEDEARRRRVQQVRALRLGMRVVRQIAGIFPGKGEHRVSAA